MADKLGVLRSLLRRVDALVVGGGMAFTFLAAAGHDIGDSMVDKERIPECAELLRSGKPILLPTDIVALEAGAAFGCDCTGGATKTVGNDIPDGWRGLDIGPATADAYCERIESAGTVLWNGPMGAFEDVRFSAGTGQVALAMAACPGYTVVGGGDSAAAVDALGVKDRISFISTGGGASLELLEYGDLPGLAALRGASNAPPTEDGDRQAPTDR